MGWMRRWALVVVVAVCAFSLHDAYGLGDCVDEGVVHQAMAAAGGCVVAIAAVRNVLRREDTEPASDRCASSSACSTARASLVLTSPGTVNGPPRVALCVMRC
jgi:hypothetical protein